MATAFFRCLSAAGVESHFALVSVLKHQTSALYTTIGQAQALVAARAIISARPVRKITADVVQVILPAAF